MLMHLITRVLVLIPILMMVSTPFNSYLSGKEYLRDDQMVEDDEQFMCQRLLDRHISLPALGNLVTVVYACTNN